MLLRRKDFEKLLTEVKRHILKKCKKISTDFKHVRESLVRVIDWPN